MADLAQLFDSISKAVPFLVLSNPARGTSWETQPENGSRWTDIGVDERHKLCWQPGEPPTIRLFWQTEAMRDARYRSPQPVRRSHSRHPGAVRELGRHLELQDGWSAQWAAVKRQAEVAAAVTGEARSSGGLQWDRQGGHTNPADPGGDRLGLASCMVSQFLQPPDEEQRTGHR